MESDPKSLRAEIERTHLALEIPLFSISPPLEHKGRRDAVHALLTASPSAWSKLKDEGAPESRLVGTAWDDVRTYVEGGNLLTRAVETYRAIGSARDALLDWRREEEQLRSRHPSERFARPPGHGFRSPPYLDHPHDILWLHFAQRCGGRAGASIAAEVSLWYFGEAVKANTLRQSCRRRGLLTP